MPDEGEAADLVRRNIDRVLHLEEHAARSKTASDIVTGRLGRIVGTLPFLAVHVAAYATWIALNAGAFHLIRPFDPPPFNLLSTITSCEAVLVASLIVMAQNRMSSLADRRDHFDLQVNLMAEQEASMTIQMLDRISKKLGVAHEDQAAAVALSRTSSLEHLAEELHARLPDTGDELPKSA